MYKTKKMKTNINHHDKSIHSDGIWHRDLFIKNSYPADYVDCFHQWVAGDAGVGSQQVCRRKRRKRAGVAADRPTTCCSFIECCAVHARFALPIPAQGSARTGSLLPLLMSSKHVMRSGCKHYILSHKRKKCQAYHLSDKH